MFRNYIEIPLLLFHLEPPKRRPAGKLMERVQSKPYCTIKQQGKAKLGFHDQGEKGTSKKAMDVKLKAESKSFMEKDGDLGWAKSLPVPRVQEMLKNDPHNVPHRYIRDQEERPDFNQLLPTSSEIPVIDFSLLAKRDQQEQKKLDSACKEWGFFQVNPV